MAEELARRVAQEASSVFQELIRETAATLEDVVRRTVGAEIERRELKIKKMEERFRKMKKSFQKCLEETRRGQIMATASTQALWDDESFLSGEFGGREFEDREFEGREFGGRELHDSPIDNPNTSGKDGFSENVSPRIFEPPAPSQGPLRPTRRPSTTLATPDLPNFAHDIQSRGPDPPPNQQQPSRNSGLRVFWMNGGPEISESSSTSQTSRNSIKSQISSSLKSQMSTERAPREQKGERKERAALSRSRSPVEVRVDLLKTRAKKSGWHSRKGQMQKRLAVGLSQTQLPHHPTTDQTIQSDQTIHLPRVPTPSSSGPLQTTARAYDSILARQKSVRDMSAQLGRTKVPRNERAGAPTVQCPECKDYNDAMRHPSEALACACKHRYFVMPSSTPDKFFDVDFPSQSAG